MLRKLTAVGCRGLDRIVAHLPPASPLAELTVPGVCWWGALIALTHIIGPLADQTAERGRDGKGMTRKPCCSYSGAVAPCLKAGCGGRHS